MATITLAERIEQEALFQECAIKTFDVSEQVFQSISRTLYCSFQQLKTLCEWCRDIGIKSGESPIDVLKQMDELCTNEHPKQRAKELLELLYKKRFPMKSMYEQAWNKGVQELSHSSFSISTAKDFEGEGILCECLGDTGVDHFIDILSTPAKRKILLSLHSLSRGHYPH